MAFIMVARCTDCPCCRVVPDKVATPSGGNGQVVSRLKPNWEKVNFDELWTSLPSNQTWQWKPNLQYRKVSSKRRISDHQIGPTGYMLEVPPARTINISGTRWTHWTQLLSLFWDKTDSNHVCYSTYLKGLKSKKRTRIYTLRGNFTLDIPWRQYFYWLQLHFLPRCPTWQPRGSPRSEPTQEKNTWNPSEDVELKFPVFFWQFERSQTFAIDYGALDLDYGVSHMWFHGPFTWHKSTWINPSFERFWYSYR